MIKNPSVGQSKSGIIPEWAFQHGMMGKYLNTGKRENLTEYLKNKHWLDHCIAWSRIDDKKSFSNFTFRHWGASHPAQLNLNAENNLCSMQLN